MAVVRNTGDAAPSGAVERVEWKVASYTDPLVCERRVRVGAHAYVFDGKKPVPHVFCGKRADVISALFMLMHQIEVAPLLPALSLWRRFRLWCQGNFSYDQTPITEHTMREMYQDRVRIALRGLSVLEAGNLLSFLEGRCTEATMDHVPKVLLWARRECSRME